MPVLMLTSICATAADGSEVGPGLASEGEVAGADEIVWGEVNGDDGTNEVDGISEGGEANVAGELCVGGDPDDDAGSAPRCSGIFTFLDSGSPPEVLRDMRSCASLTRLLRPSSHDMAFTMRAQHSSVWPRWYPSNPRWAASQPVQPGVKPYLANSTEARM